MNSRHDHPARLPVRRKPKEPRGTFTEMIPFRFPTLRTLTRFLVIVIIGVGLFVLWVRKTATTPVEHQAADQIVTIEQGTGTQAIIERLSEAGVVAHPLALKIYLRITGRGGNLKAGDYKFSSPISPLQAVEKIRRGEVDLERVTIPEGFNRFDIAEALASKTGKASFDDFVRLTNDQTLIEQIASTARDLEGYLFPDTYNYNSKTTPEDLIRTMVNRFEEVYTPEWTARANEMGLTVHQVVTLASIIEREAKVPDERPHMASVFYNRLKRGMFLESDPTFIYAAILAGDYDGNPNQLKYRNRFSRYNTYQVSGLPPGPIACPGRASLEAALYPDTTDDLYFVVTGTGGRHKFSRTAAEHDIAVQEYRRQQREARQ